MVLHITVVSLQIVVSVVVWAIINAIADTNLQTLRQIVQMIYWAIIFVIQAVISYIFVQVATPKRIDMHSDSSDSDPQSEHPLDK